MINIENKFLTSCLIYLFAGLLMLLAPVVSIAQDQPVDTTETVQPPASPAWPDDTLGRRTPRGTVEGFIRAVARENYQRAAAYLRIDSALQVNQEGANLARALHQLLDQRGNILPYQQISKDQDGFKDDNLGPNLDRIGSATLNGETFSIILERIQGEDGGPLWLFSSQTVQRLPLNSEAEIDVALVSRLSPEVLEQTKWGGVPVGHWLAILLVVIIAYIISWLLIKLLLLLIPVFWKKASTDPTNGIIAAFGLPLRIYLAVWLFVAINEQIGISIIIRQQFSTITFGVGIAALLLLIWRLFNASTLFAERRLSARNNMAGVSAVLFARRIAKVAIIIIGALVILDSFGFDVTTGIAALGIGGLALALGAQKTVENFVGSVTLIADQPVRVGDFCKVGETIGTVEQIGMRSTRIRTLDRTVVTIPNGEFSSQRIENFAHRDRFKLQVSLGVRFETSTEQMRYLLVELRAILYAHPRVVQDLVRVRFKEIGADSLNIEAFTYVQAKDFSEFLEIQEDIFLRMMDKINQSGTGFAFPSQTLYLAKDEGLSKEKTADAEARVRQWREAGELQIPAFAPERIEKLQGTIKYPPEGAAVQPPEEPTLF